MEEWLVVALILIGLSLLVSLLLVVACKALGGWSYLFAWATGNKDERANLANQEEYGGYADYVRNSSRVQDMRPPLIEPHNCFSSNLKSSDKWSDMNKAAVGGGVATAAAAVIPPTLPPPHSNGPSSKRFSLDIARRTSIDTSELPDVLAETGASNARLQRAMSCDSVCSDTSVVLETLDSPEWTAELNLSLEYSSQRQELLVEVNQARGLPTFDKSASTLQSYVKILLLPSQTNEVKTKVQTGTSEPSYNEQFIFRDLTKEDLRRQVLRCFTYVCDHTAGETEVRLSDIDTSSRYRAWLPISNEKQKTKGVGELLFSLSYLPTAERMTVVLVKARNIVWSENKPSADLFVKVYLLQKGKKISKKKTSVKRGDRNPTFNEAMIFSVPATALQNIQLRLTLAELELEGKKTPAIGHVFVGSQCSGKELSHWNQMISSPRKPIAMWHSLRKRER